MVPLAPRVPRAKTPMAAARCAKLSDLTCQRAGRQGSGDEALLGGGVEEVDGAELDLELEPV